MTNVDVMIIPPEGPIDCRTVPNTLEAFQALVGGYIETLSLDHEAPGLTAIIDEQGKLKHLPVNCRASLISGLMPIGDVVVGPMVVVGGSDDSGEFTSLTVPVVNQVHQHLRQLMAL